MSGEEVIAGKPSEQDSEVKRGIAMATTASVPEVTLVDHIEYFSSWSVPFTESYRSLYSLRTNLEASSGRKKTAIVWQRTKSLQKKHGYNSALSNSKGTTVRSNRCDQSPRRGTPLYGLYRYVRPKRVWFFIRFGHR